MMDDGDDVNYSANVGIAATLWPGLPAEEAWMSGVSYLLQLPVINFPGIHYASLYTQTHPFSLTH